LRNTATCHPLDECTEVLQSCPSGL
jgi:hypothetical protein